MRCDSIVSVVQTALRPDFEVCDMNWIPARKSQSGQVIVLSAVSLLVVALMVFLSLNVNRAVHEKIRLQNFSDAEAFAQAVNEARALNYMAYSNRAIAATMVGMAATHVYEAMATQLVDLDFSGATIQFEISAIEFAKSIGYWGIPCIKIADGPMHCVHSGQAAVNGAMLMIRWLSRHWANKVQKLDPDFHNAAATYEDHRKAIGLTQLQMTGQLIAMLGTGAGDSVKLVNLGPAKKGKVNVKIGANSGMNILGYTRQFDTFSSNSSQQKEARKQMQNFANSSRGVGIARHFGIIGVVQANAMSNIVLQPAMDKEKNSTPGGFTSRSGGKWSMLAVFQSPFMGGAGITDSELGGITGGLGFTDVSTTGLGEYVAAYQTCMVTGTWAGWNPFSDTLGGVAPLPMLSIAGPGRIKTGKKEQGGGNYTHDVNFGIEIGGSPHKGSTQHSNKYKVGTAPGSGATGGSSGWADYKFTDQVNSGGTTARKDIDSKLPTILVAVDYSDVKDLQSNDSNYQNSGSWKAPWNLNFNNFHTADGDPTRTNFKMARSGDAKLKPEAFSKAKVYYHHFGNWKEQPNLFNPFWRAKMEHPSATDILLMTGSLSGDSQTFAGAARVAESLP